MTRGDALAKLQELLHPINARVRPVGTLPTNFGLYVSTVFVPHQQKSWKHSTKQTTTERIAKHLIPEFEGLDLRDLTRGGLQEFLDRKAERLSRSVIDHLRWDLKAILRMAGDDGLVTGNAAGSLVTPRWAKTAEKRVMNKIEFNLALSVLEAWERIVLRLAALVGMRPGEILALRWAKVEPELINIAERVYRGLPDTPKTVRGKRNAALPPALEADIESWRQISRDTSPDALVFPSERGTYFLRDNFLRRNLQSKLAKVGLGWVNFQVLRRTQASVAHNEGLDPKVLADQRGHGIGVALDVYTRTDLASRRSAVTRLEAAFQEPQQGGWRPPASLTR